jgi:pyrroloquinoline quinone (PQQ) biosynthesis protein C
MEDIAVKNQEERTGPRSDLLEPTAPEDFPNAMAAMLEEHRPSRMPFFGRLANLPSTVVSDPLFLGQIHLIYQSAMHATRAAVYYLPHLDSPALRKRKLQIFIDDDGLPDGDTHHYQLTRAFLSIGAKCLLDEEEFGEPGELCHYLEAETAQFVRLAPKLYSRSLGPWCAVEMLSVDWMRALADALSAHFPHFKHERYFEDCFSQRVEERHAAEAAEVTQMVLRARPELLAATLRDAKMMAEALDGVWTHLDRIARSAGAQSAPRSGIAVQRHRARVLARRARVTDSPASAVQVQFDRVC